VQTFKSSTKFNGFLQIDLSFLRHFDWESPDLWTFECLFVTLLILEQVEIFPTRYINSRQFYNIINPAILSVTFYRLYVRAESCTMWFHIFHLLLINGVMARLARLCDKGVDKMSWYVFNFFEHVLCDDVVKVPLGARERSSCTSNYRDPAFPRLKFR